MRLWLAFLACTLAACAIRYDYNKATLMENGTRLCARHRVPLVSVSGFVADDLSKICCFDKKYIRLTEVFPNGLNPRESLTKNELHRFSGPVTYCTLCEEAIRSKMD